MLKFKVHAQIKDKKPEASSPPPPYVEIHIANVNLKSVFEMKCRL